MSSLDTACRKVSEIDRMHLSGLLYTTYEARLPSTNSTAAVYPSTSQSWLTASRWAHQRSGRTLLLRLATRRGQIAQRVLHMVRRCYIQSSPCGCCRPTTYNEPKPANSDHYLKVIESLVDLR